MRVAFQTLGCRLNQFETEGMRHRLERAMPVELVEWEQGAELYVINSCAVTGRAEQKCRQLARAAKRRSPGARVVVVGCQAQLGGAALLEHGAIDAVLGNEEKKRLDEFLPRILDGEAVAMAAPQRRGLAMADEWIGEFGALSRATIKVQEGCDMRCTFCAIWRAKGPSRSRPPRDVVEQASRLAALGYTEVVLAGVHIGHYGRDLEPPTDLHGLLDMLLEQVDGGVRFRVSSIEPAEVDRAMAERLAADPRLCRYLHLPLQSGSDAVLRRMRRAYSARYYEQLVERVAALDPHFGVGADIIVGFPGETDEEFEATHDLLERLPVSFYHVFRYSDRPRTPAERMPGKVPGDVAAARSARLRELGERRQREFLASLVGQPLDAVVESTTDGEGRNELMADNYASVWARVPAGLDRQRTRVRPTGLSATGKLLGELVRPAVATQGKA